MDGGAQTKGLLDTTQTTSVNQQKIVTMSLDDHWQQI
jgi:hypothetical protein